MKEHFLFILRNNRNRKFLKIGWFLLVLNILFFIMLLRAYSDDPLKTILIPLIILALLSTFAVKKWNRKAPSFEPRLLSFALFIAALGWWLVEQPIPAIGHLLMVFLGWKLPVRAEIIFHENGITVPAMPSKTFAWNTIQHVIWKDGLLTIDFKNNVIIQEETVGSFSEEDNRAFREFVDRNLQDVSFGKKSNAG